MKHSFWLLAAILAACNAPRAVVDEKPFGDPENRPHPEPTKPYDITHYVIDVTPDFEKREIDGRVTIHLTATEPTSRLTLHADDMTIKSVKLDGADAKFTHADGAITIDAALAAGQGVAIDVAYLGKPNARGWFWVAPDKGYPDKPLMAWTQGEAEYNHYWFPCWDFPNDLATSEVKVHAPKGMKVVSNGARLKAPDGAYAHHRMDVPHVSYLTSIVIGDLDVVPGEANVAGRAIPLFYNVPKGRMSEADVRRFFDVTEDLLEWFSKVLDCPYPYPKYDQTLVIDFTWGGMENVTATTLNGDRIIAGALPGSDYTPEGLIAHELAHQWFGDLVTCRTWAHVWLNEGWATYMTNLWFEHSRGVDEFRHGMTDNQNGVLGQDKAYRRPIVTDRYSAPDDMFDGRSYAGAASMMHMLRFVLGDDAFFRGVRRYLRDRRATCATTEDFQAAFEAECRTDLGWFFKQWFYTPGAPEFKVRYTWADGVVTVVVEQPTVFKTPVDISVDDRRERFFIDEAREEFRIPAPEKPRLVDFDCDGWLLKILDFDKSDDELAYQLAHDDVTGREWAAGQLGSHKSRVADLATALADPFWGVRLAAANALGGFKDDAALRALEGALTDADPRVREAAVAGIAAQGGRADLLLKLALDDPWRRVAQKATSCLTDYDDIQQVIAKRADNADVLVGAIQALTTLGDPRGFDYVASWTAYGKPAWPRGRAIAALETWDKTKHAEVQKRLLELVADPDFGTRRSAIDALGNVGDPAAVAALEKVAKDEPELRLRKKAREAIDKIKKRG